MPEGIRLVCKLTNLPFLFSLLPPFLHLSSSPPSSPPFLFPSFPPARPPLLPSLPPPSSTSLPPSQGIIANSGGVQTQTDALVTLLQQTQQLQQLQAIQQQLVGTNGNPPAPQGDEQPVFNQVCSLEVPKHGRVESGKSYGRD